MRDQRSIPRPSTDENRILVVDDQPENGRLVANMLCKAGYRIQLAEDAPAALALVAARPPTLILLDVMMPGMDGFEMCRRLKADSRTADIPIIFLTGRDDSESLKAGFDVGGADYITKPIDENVLLARIGSQVRLLRQRRRLRERELELARARRMETIGRLAGGVAHEFNNLLQVVVGYAELLEGQLEDASLRELIQPILESGSRGKEIVRELLAYTDQDGTAKRTMLDLADAVRNSRQILARAMTEEIELKIETEDASILGDLGEIQQIITNLCFNAKEAILPGHGIVSVRTGSVRFAQSVRVHEATMPPGEYAFLTVADSGRGIPPEELGSVFEPFFSTREVGEGTGLGLSVVWGILRRHEAYVDVHSVPGEGTEVICYFPHVMESVTALEGPESPRAAGASDPRRVLVCEDDPLVRGFTVDLFESLGYEVDVTENGRELISKIDGNHRHYALIYTDIAMPRMSGPAAIEAVRARFGEETPPVIFATGHGDGDVRRHLGVPESEVVLRKPFTRAELAEAVTAANVGTKPRAVDAAGG